MNDKLFLDANVLFSAAYRRNSGLLVLWKLTGVDLVSSSYAVEEAHRNLGGAQKTELEALLNKVKIVKAVPTDVILEPTIYLPEKDKPILFAAIYSKTTHLITGDVTHFGDHFNSTINGVLIINPAGYMKSRME